ncbi:MAG: ice-binding family protein [Salinivirgaceae bacterium]|jgi:hypothetical protein|nr:ice-binding family protein [Salinivirgaceae bacterium]
MRAQKLLTALTLAMVVFIAGCKDDDYTEIDGVCPLVTSTTPTNGAVNVPLNIIITATFNEAMNPATITQAAFSLQSQNAKKSTSSDVMGTITYDVSTNTASFTPNELLVANTAYTCIITEAVEDLNGTALQVNYVFTFSTGLSTMPAVVSTDPTDLEADVLLDKVITATFSEAMDPLTITDLNFMVETSEGIAVTGTVDLDATGLIASFTPDVNLSSESTYVATITTGAENVAGTPIASNYNWTFSTGLTIGPKVESTDPTDLEADVSFDKIITATFSEAMDPLTVTDLTFTAATSGGVSVTGIVDLDGTGLIATFTPDVNLLPESTYIATITTGAENVAGTPMANDYVWEFYTAAHSGPQDPYLLSVARFGIIAGVGVTNAAGPSEINDLDVGIYPGVRSSIVGFSDVDGGPGIINNGDFYAANDASPVPAMLLLAKNDLVVVYLEIEGATSPAPATVAGDLGGQTLAPGIYKSTSTLKIESGNLTLDAQGDENAVWIFQIASDFTTFGGGPFPSAGGNVILTGGAQAKNVYWQVGSSATIGDYTSFKGNVLALTSITMNAYSVAEGRMLCQNGSIVLTSTNIINKP